MSKHKATKAVETDGMTDEEREILFGEREDVDGEEDGSKETVQSGVTTAVLKQTADAVTKVGEAVEALAKNQKPRTLGIHERQIRSPHNPTGNRNRRFVRGGYKTYVWVNMTPVMPHLAGDAAFEFVPKVAVGTYMRGRVNVSEQRTGSNMNLYITYPDTRDEAMINKGLWSTFEDLLEKCVQAGPMTADQLATVR